MSAENFPLVPFNQDRAIEPSKRRFLTASSKNNPTRYETGALIPLTQDEARQILSWGNNAVNAINEIGHILATLPGETTTSLEEQRKTSSTERSTRKQDENTRISGFFTINVYRALQEGQDRHIETNTQRDSKEVAKIRPGQFLTGGQINDALGRVAIAKGEGLLLLPAASSEINRRQLTFLQTTKRVLEDHGDSNSEWAEDIQEGTIIGLINQLEQTSAAIRNGYLAKDLDPEISENVKQTLTVQLYEDLETAFTSLLQFSLLKKGRVSALEKAGDALKSCIVKDLYEIDPSKTIKFFSIWLELFSHHAQGENARIIGTAYGDALSICILKEQENEDTTVFGNLSDIAIATAAKHGGADLLLNTAINQSKEILPNQKTIELLSRITEHVQKSYAIESIISLIRFSVLQTQDETTIGLLKKLSWESRLENDKFHVVNNVIDLPFSVFPRLVSSLTPDEWEKVKAIINQKGEPWEAKPQITRQQANILPVDFKDPEVTEDISNSFASQIRRLIQGSGRLRDSMFDSKALKYMYSNCKEEARNQLTLDLIQRLKVTLPKAVGFVESHMSKILKLASNRTLQGSRYETPDHQMPHAIYEISSTREQIFSERSFTNQLATIFKIFERLEEYRNRINRNLSIDFSFNPFSGSSNYRRLKTNVEAIIKQEEYKGLTEELAQLKELATVIFATHF